MIDRLPFEKLLNFKQELPVVDVRTPAEYENGHIPGSFNIPLFSNEERAHVGTVYKKQSQQKAIDLGYKYVNPKLDYFISAAKEVAPYGKLAVYCWRGGKRSKAFAEHLHENGFAEVNVIENGYKGYRNFAVEAFDKPSEIFVLGGYTGTGKTRILEMLDKSGHQVIDLERLANHKGSAFGGIGQEKQPTTEHFANLIYWKWKDLDLSKPIWLEDESSNIGRINIPENLFSRMRDSKVWFLKMPKEKRAEILVKEYAACDREGLAAAIQRISKKLGGLRASEALDHLAKGNYYETALITLDYYDKFYLRGLQRRDEEKVVIVESSNIDARHNADLLVGSLQDK